MVKKGITPVISVVLLIMLVVAITGGAYYWMTNVQGSLQESVGASVESGSNLASTSFSIVSVVCDDDGNSDTITATVINTGSQDINLDDIAQVMTVSSLQGIVLGVDSDGLGGAGTLSPGDSASLSGFGGENVIVPDSTYSVRVNLGSSSQTSVCTATD